MKAIVDLDHPQKHHRAIAMRPNLEGPYVFLPGAQVFYWQAQGAAGRFRGRRRRQFDRWRHPGTAIGREMRNGQEREGYWVSHAGYLRLRPASREEQIPEHDAIRRLNKIVDELSTRDQLVYENLIGQDDPDEIEVPAGNDHDDFAPRKHRSHASSSMLDPDREPEPSPRRKSTSAVMMDEMTTSRWLDLRPPTVNGLLNKNPLSSPTSRKSICWC